MMKNGLKEVWATHLNDRVMNVYFVEMREFKNIQEMEKHLMKIADFFKNINILLLIERDSPFPQIPVGCVHTTASIMHWNRVIAQLVRQPGNVREIIEACRNLYELKVLNKHQKNIASELIKGFSISEISKKFSINERTVYAHIKKIACLLGFGNSSKLINYLRIEFKNNY